MNDNKIDDRKYGIPDSKVYTKEGLAFFQEVEDYIESDEYEEMPAEEFERQMAFYKKTAENTLKKLTEKKNYALRLNPRDIDSIKAMALRKGLPYQTFISSILHQVATKQIEV